NDDVVPTLEMHDDARIPRKVDALLRFGRRTEPERAVGPHRPERRSMWTAVSPRRAQPVVPRLLQPLDGPCPRQALGAGCIRRDAVDGRHPRRARTGLSHRPYSADDRVVRGLLAAAACALAL